MKTPEQIVKTKRSDKIFLKPFFLKLSKKKDQATLKKLWATQKIQFITDEYKAQIMELIQIKNPSLVDTPAFKIKYQNYLRDLNKKSPLWQQGMWVYYPWIAHLVHILDEDAFFQVRTARNKNLITEGEQLQFYNATVGIAGLSIGSSIAITLVLQGGAKHIKLADFDILELSNTNRIRTGIDALGLPKVEMTARQIYLLNPYAKIELFRDGLHKKNIAKFFKGLDVVIDEIDDFPTKILLRNYAKKASLPLITSIDNSDGSVLEIERYDRNKKVNSFAKSVGNISYEKAKKMSKIDVGRLIAHQVGVENITSRMYDSFSEIGKSIVSWPQLGGAALLNGVLVSYSIRQIVLHKGLKNRSVISIDDLLQSKPPSKQQKIKMIKKYSKLFQ